MRRRSLAPATWTQAGFAVPVSNYCFRIGWQRGGATIASLAPVKSAFPKIRFAGNGKTFDLYDYLAINRVAKLLVLKEGSIALEDYELGVGHRRAGHRSSWRSRWPRR
jgi:hypothetical protein